VLCVCYNLSKIETQLFIRFLAVCHTFQFFLQFVTIQCLQCFDTVGWAAGKASGL